MNQNLYIACIIACVTCSALCAQEKPAETKAPAARKEAELPGAIVTLQSKLKGQSAEAIRAILMRELGAPTRRVGSGELHDQWDIAGGTVSFPPAIYRTKTRTVWLVETQTPLGGALRGSFEMTTAPDPTRHGNRFWIGGVALLADGTYQYATHDANPRERKQQKGNFFIDHPRGTYELRYPEGLTEKTLLESTGDEKKAVALLTLSSGEGQAAVKAQFEIHSDGSARRLHFTDDAAKALSFCLEKGW